MVYIKRKCAESTIHFNLNAHLRGKHLAISDHLLTHIGKERITYVFIAQLWIKLVCIHIGNSSEHRQTHLQFSKYLWMFDTE